MQAAPDTTTLPRYLTIDEVVTLTRLSRSTVYALFAAGLPCVKLGRRRLVPAEALQRYLDQHTTGGEIDLPVSR